MNLTNNKNIILVNKPKHWTSNDVVRKVKNILKVKKIGHAGTLDPLATGLLILGVNSGTKQLNDLLTYKKSYIATIHFNYYTSTYDSEGEVLEYQKKEIQLSDIKKVLDIWMQVDYFQYPPKFSAIKINGKKAYELARQNVDFEIKPKLVKLLDYKIISFEHNELIIEIEVTKGFYVRSFAYDLGKKLDNFACLAGLIRNKIGEFKLEEAYDIQDLYDYSFE